jgi:hypothetical protein
VLLVKNAGDQIKKNELGRACGTYGERRVTYTLWWKNLGETDRLKDLDADGRVILKWVLKKVGWGMDWIDVAQDRNKWQSLVYAVINLRFQKMLGFS